MKENMDYLIEELTKRFNSKHPEYRGKWVSSYADGIIRLYFRNLTVDMDVDALFKGDMKAGKVLKIWHSIYGEFVNISKINDTKQSLEENMGKLTDAVTKKWRLSHPEYGKYRSKWKVSYADDTITFLFADIRVRMNIDALLSGRKEMIKPIQIWTAFSYEFDEFVEISEINGTDLMERWRGTDDVKQNLEENIDELIEEITQRFNSNYPEYRDKFKTSYEDGVFTFSFRGLKYNMDLESLFECSTDKHVRMWNNIYRLFGECVEISKINDSDPMLEGISEDNDSGNGIKAVPETDRLIQRGFKIGMTEGYERAVYDFVAAGLITEEQGAAKLQTTAAGLKKDMEDAGYMCH